jgi:tetratricopeptide (TPR) repeat protein
VKVDREKQLLERILSLKSMVQDGRGGPIELHELGICYYLIDNCKSAAHYLQELAEKYPDYLEIAAAQALRVYCLIQDGEMLEAEILLKERIPRDPTNTSLLAMLSHVQEKTHRIDEALATHRRILAMDPGNINSKNSLGYLLAKHGKKTDMAQAFAHLKDAVSEKPDHPAYLDSLGVLLARQGEKERARKAFLKALRKAPGNAEILDHLKDIID